MGEEDWLRWIGRLRVGHRALLCTTRRCHAHPSALSVPNQRWLFAPARRRKSLDTGYGPRGVPSIACLRPPSPALPIVSGLRGWRRPWRRVRALVPVVVRSRSDAGDLRSPILDRCPQAPGLTLERIERGAHAGEVGGGGRASLEFGRSEE